MTTTTLETVGDITPSATEHFADLVAGPIVLTRWLQAALALALVTLVGVSVLLFHAQSQLANVKPLVIRIDQVGRAEAVAYDAATWKPQTPELKYFLTRFTTLHFSRARATVGRDFAESLLFLNAALSDSIIADRASPNAVETFVQNPSAEEVEITVTNVTFSELAAQPFRASVDFTKVYVDPSTRQPRRSELFTAQVDFTLLDSVPNAFIPVNPLGLHVTHFRVDQAF